MNYVENHKYNSQIYLYLEMKLIEFAQPTFDYEFSAMSLYSSLSGERIISTTLIHALMI